MTTIPPARREAVRAALHRFGMRQIPLLHPIKGGVSGALILRFEYRERAYVLRMEPARVALADRERNYAAMRSAAAAGAAPPVRYAEAASGVAILDFIPSRPLTEFPGGSPGLIRALGALTAKVQAAEPFATLGLYPDVIAGSLDGLATIGFVAPAALVYCRDALARIRAALPWDPARLVSAHNDPNPRNLLFDGERLWLVDWELAFRNDPLADIAILATEFAETPEREESLLEAAFGNRPSKALVARLGVIRLLTRLFYGCIVFDSLRGMTSPEIGDSGRSPSAFRAAVAEGRLTSGSPEVAYAFAMMSLNAFQDGVNGAGFSQMLARAGDA